MEVSLHTGSIAGNALMPEYRAILLAQGYQVNALGSRPLAA